MNIDTNAVIYTYLQTQAELTGIVSSRIYCPRLPQNATLPAIAYLSRGGLSDQYIPGELFPSIQFDCFAEGTLYTGPPAARRVYRALYEALQGIQNISVASPSIVVGTDGNDYSCILSHIANNRNKPITGALTATYWSATGGTGIGSIWISGAGYRPTHEIVSAEEEVQGQDLMDVDIQNYYRVLTFFRIKIRAE